MQGHFYLILQQITLSLLPIKEFFFALKYFADACCRLAAPNHLTSAAELNSMNNTKCWFVRLFVRIEPQDV